VLRVLKALKDSKALKAFKVHKDSKVCKVHKASKVHKAFKDRLVTITSLYLQTQDQQ